METFNFNGLNLSLNKVSADLYLNWGEQQPDNAPDSWFEPRGQEDITVDKNEVIKALTGAQELCTTLNMNRGYTEEEIQTLFYDVAKTTFGEEKAQIRTFFKYMYQFVLGSQSGPRWGQFISILGIEEFLDRLHMRLGTYEETHVYL